MNKVLESLQNEVNENNLDLFIILKAMHVLDNITKHNGLLSADGRDQTLASIRDIIKNFFPVLLSYLNKKEGASKMEAVFKSIKKVDSVYDAVYKEDLN